MSKLYNQEKSAEIQNLQRLLKSVPKETKPEHEWQVLENMLFARMDEMEQAHTLKSEKPSWRTVPVAPVFSRRLAALGAAACIVLMLGAGSLYVASRSVSKSLAHSQILGIKGTVTYTTPTAETAGTPDQQPPILFRNQVFATEENATCIVRIDEKSCFLLSEKTKLTVNKADTRAIEFFLHTGSILAHVNKRDHSQTFTVKTTDATCKVVGTIFKVAASPGTAAGSTHLTVIEGTVDIAKKGDSGVHELVNSGETIQVCHNTLQAPRPASENQMNIHALSLIRLVEEMSCEKSVPTGLLDVSSTPAGAKIFIEDKYIGTTPLAINYPEGSYAVRLSLPGYAIWERIISVKKLNSRFVTAHLDIERDQSAARSRVAKKRAKKAPHKVAIAMKSPPIVQAPQEKTKDFGFIMNAAFVEALVQMTVGEYQKALIILDSLKELPEISVTERIRIMSKIAACYKGMGNFENTLKNLTARYTRAEDPIEKSNLLWEIITVKANCLLDYEGAENDILTYIKNYPDGPWLESAYAKLGEIQYMTGKYSKAVGTYQYHVNLFKTSSAVEKSVYTIANIMRLDIKDYALAITWYTKLLKEYTSSNYYGNALFERADCYEKTNQHAKARKDYTKYLQRYPEGHLKALCLSRLSSQE